MSDFFQLSQHFSANPEMWQADAVSLGLPLRVKLLLKKLQGSLVHASDIRRPLVWQKDGVFVRDLEPGEPIGNVARDILLRRGQWQVRQDRDPGCRRVLLFLHMYKSMEFAGSHSKTCKGQVALAAASLIAAFHKNLLQPVRVVVSRNEDLSSQMSSLRLLAMKNSSVYFISDFLSADFQQERAGSAFFSSLASLRTRDVSCVVVRDVLEWTVNNPLGNRARMLEPFSSIHEGGNILFSGEDYIARLASNFEMLRNFARINSMNMSPLTGSTSLVEFVSDLALIARKRGVL